MLLWTLGYMYPFELVGFFPPDIYPRVELLGYTVALFFNFIFNWRTVALQYCTGFCHAAAAAAKSLQLCPTLCDPIDGNLPGSPVPGILQARTLEWVAISFSNAWKWKVKVKLLSRVRLLATPWTAAHQAPPSMGFSRQEDWSGCHRLLLLCMSRAPRMAVWRHQRDRHMLAEWQQPLYPSPGHRAYQVFDFLQHTLIMMDLWIFKLLIHTIS